MHPMLAAVKNKRRMRPFIFGAARDAVAGAGLISLKRDFRHEAAGHVLQKSAQDGGGVLRAVKVERIGGRFRP